MALERLKSCRNATELAAELGIHRTQLYKWRDQMERFLDHRLSFLECTAALDAALADLLPRLTTDSFLFAL